MNSELIRCVLPFTWSTIGTAILCGGIVGFERQIRGKTAGIRTSIMICLGTAIFIQLAASLGGPNTDPSRVLGQVITGIGFLGAGVILSRGGLIKGVTSASIIWMLSCIGAVVGLKYYAAALVLTLVTIGVLTGVEILEYSFRKLRRGVHASEKEERWYKYRE